MHSKRLFLFIADIGADEFGPSAVQVCNNHIFIPDAKHIEDGGAVNEPRPGMPHSRSRASAEEHGNPEQRGRPKGQASKQTINVGESRETVHDTLTEVVAKHAIAANDGFLTHY